MNKTLGFILAFGSGLCIGIALTMEGAKARAQAEVLEAAELANKAAAKAAEIREEREAKTFDPELAVEHAVIVQRYQVEPVEPNTGIHHIQEIDFEEDEAFDKIVVEIFMTDDIPVFLFNGTETPDWYDHLGPTIVLTGDETMDNETFYVRNHSLRCDYEVTWGKP